MRFVVLLFGFLGVVLTATAGFGLLMLKLAAEFLSDNSIKGVEFLYESPLGVPHENTGFFLLVTAGYGLLGTILAFARCGWQGALLLIVPALCTAAMNYYTPIFTGLQIIAGLLSFLVSPLPIAPPEDD